MQSLRNNMDGMSISAPSNIETSRRQSSHQLQNELQQPYVKLNGPMPLHGSNEYTKTLMTRIATGEATPEERARWEQHVAMVRSQPVSSVHNNAFDQPPSLNPPPPPPQSAQPALHDFQSQLLTMSQEERGNLLLARQEQDTAAQAAPQIQSLPPAVPSAALSKYMSHAQQDYEMQLMLLEQQNKRRLLQVRQDQDSKAQAEAEAKSAALRRGAQMGQPMQSVGAVPSHSQHRAPANHNTALQDYQYSLMLEESKRRKELAVRAANLRNAKPEEPQVKQATRKNAAKYTEPFCKFLTENPTVFHAVDAVKKQLKDAGFTELSERDNWDIKPSGSYFVERNGSSLIAFTVGAKYDPGNGAAILAGHVDALTAKLKPISQVPNKAGYLQLGIAPYAGAPNTTWWDRDLSIGGRVLVKESNKIVTKLVKLDWPIARIPTLAPHFGAAANGPFNPETQMVPIIGLEGTDASATDIQTAEPFSQPSLLGGDAPVGSFVNTQPPRLVRAIGNALGLKVDTYSNMVNWELELFDTQPATVGGLDKEFIFAGRVDDKLCSWAAIQALLEAQDDTENSSMIKTVGLFDDEEIGSLLRQGARGNFLPQTLERAVGSLADHHPTSDLMGRTFANSFIVSSDVIHAVNPNFLGAYLENHSPHLNVGVVVSADSNGHMTTDSVSTAIFKRCADKVGAKLQVFQIRNDSRSGGTVGPMLSSMTGIRAIDAGIPQLSMHSIRATTGSLDPGLGVLCFLGFLNEFESVDNEFRD